MRFFEGREGMGGGFPYDGNFFDVNCEQKAELVVVAQRVLEQQGKPFTIVLQQDAPLRTEYWDGYEARVLVAVNGKRHEGYGSSANNVVEAYGQALSEALFVDFPQLRNARFPNARVVSQNGHSHTEIEFSTGTQRWISRNGGLVESPQGMGTLVAEGFMAGVHLTRP